MRVGYDATPLLGRRTGIGRYTEHLLAALAHEPGVAVTPTAFTFRGRDALPAAVPAGMVPRSLPVPANLLQQVWMRVDTPPVELLCGRVEVFHGTNFVLPPLRRAAGVVTVHDLAYLRLPEVVDRASQRFRALVPRGLRRAALVLTPSQATAEDVVDAYGFPAERVVVTPLGVTPDWFAAAPPDEALRRRLGLPASYLLAVGTQEPRKGLDVLLDALALLPDAPPLVLVGARGWGPALALGSRVVELGWLDTADLQRVTAGAAALVYPSRHEGFGLPPLEALACGAPVVCSDLPVLREACGPHAVYAPVGDAQALAAAVEHVVTGGGPTPPEQRVAHARAATWERTAARTVAAYRRAAA